VISEHRYLQGYFAVQKAHEAVLKREKGTRPESVHVPCTVSFATNRADSLWNAFEILIRQRTEVLCSYKQRLEQANAELLSLSVTDSLTGLLNRRRFQEVLENEVARARRYGPLSLLIIDLDLFKQVNDQYGHPVGDEALRCVAAVLKTSCRATDFCARLGGDEFAVILPHADRRAAELVRDRILHSIAETRVPAGALDLRIRLSIGMSTLDPDNSAEQLVAAADADMYRVKQASRSEPSLTR